MNNSNNRKNNNKNKKKFEKGKNPESYEKKDPHPLEQAPEKIESFIPPSLTRTVLAAPKKYHTKCKTFHGCKSCKEKS